MAHERQKGGGKLSRSETVTVRLDPKLRYMAELAARRQRRTLSSYIEWAMEDSLKHFSLDLSGNLTLADEAEALWDVDDADRFARLALRHPDLLTHEEQVRWKLIRECGLLWRGSYKNKKWTWIVREESLVFATLREYWEAFCGVSDGSMSREALPEWVEEEEVPEPDGDDIPF